MPFSEKKGRFTVSITQQQTASKPSAGPSQPASATPAGSPSSGSSRAVKRGRFLVSCCSSSPRLAPTLSLQQEEVGLFNSSQGTNAFGSRSTCSSDDTHVTGMDHSATAAAEVTSPCRAGAPCPAPAAMPSQAAAGQGVSPAQSPEPRRVRFSETAEDLCMAYAGPAQPFPQQEQQAQAHAQGRASTAAPIAGKRNMPDAPKQLKHTRSYCSGRFTIQEAAYTQGVLGPLHRSTSAPECAGGLSSSTSSCSSLQASCGPFATAHAHSGSSSPGSSESCFAQAGAGSCAQLYAANQLMSGIVQFQQQQEAHLQHQASTGLMYHPGTGFPAGAHAAGSTGGLLSSVSVPVPVLSSASSEEEGSLMSSLTGSGAGSYLMSSDAGNFSSAPTSRQRSASSQRRGSGNNLLSSCYSGSAELLSAAAAAAVGHHPHHQPKRSASMTYFRRGRFLVQTTMG